MRCFPKGFGGERTDAEAFKREAWFNLGMLVVSVTDQRLTWPERELVQQLGEKLYGKTRISGVRHD